jgi:hypothetical protein
MTDEPLQSEAQEEPAIEIKEEPAPELKVKKEAKSKVDGNTDLEL